jgi:hypothetical protein
VHAKVLQQLGWLYHQDGPPFQNQDLAIQYLTKSLEAGESLYSLLVHALNSCQILRTPKAGTSWDVPIWLAKSITRRMKHTSKRFTEMVVIQLFGARLACCIFKSINIAMPWTLTHVLFGSIHTYRRSGLISAASTRAAIIK